MLLKVHVENKGRIAKASDPTPSGILKTVTKGKLPAILEEGEHKKSGIKSS